MWRNVLLENVTVQVDPNCPIPRRTDLFGGSVFWDTQPNCLDSFNKAHDLFPSIVFAFVVDCQPHYVSKS